MKMLPQEMRRIRQNALLLKRVSPDTKHLILKNELSEFAKGVFDVLQRKKSIKNAMVVLVETEKEEG